MLLFWLSKKYINTENIWMDAYHICSYVLADSMWFVFIFMLWAPTRAILMVENKYNKN